MGRLGAAARAHRRPEGGGGGGLGRWRARPRPGRSHGLGATRQRLLAWLGWPRRRGLMVDHWGRLEPASGASAARERRRRRHWAVVALGRNERRGRCRGLGRLGGGFWLGWRRRWRRGSMMGYWLRLGLAGRVGRRPEGGAGVGLRPLVSPWRDASERQCRGLGQLGGRFWRRWGRRWRRGSMVGHWGRLGPTGRVRRRPEGGGGVGLGRSVVGVVTSHKPNSRGPVSAGASVLFL